MGLGSHRARLLLPRCICMREVDKGRGGEDVWWRGRCVRYEKMGVEREVMIRNSK